MSANPRPLVATLYNPHTQSKEALIAGFIVRKRLFERLFRDINTASMNKPEQHYLIQGIRGMGKTTLLLRLAYEVENTPELRNQLIPIVFNEEEYGISSLADVWERTALYLEEADPSFGGIYQAVRAQYGQVDYERRTFGMLTQRLHERGKKLLVLIDNISDILRKLDKQEEQRLREILLTSPDLRIIGATPVLIEQFHEYTRPFYEFFKVIHLEGLSREEAPALFLKLGETYHTETIQQIVKHQPGRIEALRRLTGGVIRTMVLLYEILVENGNGSVFRDLQVLLDRVTPLYKHRMDDLSAQQQKIVAALAQAWDAASTKELAQTVRLESKVISAQLTQLINNGIVEKIETNTKNHLYRLEERFFNIWYLMRFGRTTDQRVLWLIRFFEEMFGEDAEWLQERINQHLAAIEKGEFDPEAALYLTATFRRIVKNKEVEYKLIENTKTYLLNNGHRRLANQIEHTEYEEITQLLKHKQYKDSISLLTKFIKYRSLNIYLDLVACYLLIDREDIARVYFIELMKIGNKLIGQVTSAFRLNRISRYRKTKSISGLYPIYEEFVTLLIDSKNPETIKITASLPELIAEIAMIYFNKCIVNRKELAYEIIETLLNIYSNNSLLKSTPNIRTTICIISLWNNQYNLLNNEKLNPLYDLNPQNDLTFYTARLWLYDTYLKLLLAKKQYHTAYQYFQQEEWQLKDRFKPLYYATLHYLRDEHPTDYLRMGPELKETVADLITEVEQMAIDYA